MKSSIQVFLLPKLGWPGSPKLEHRFAKLAHDV